MSVSPPAPTQLRAVVIRFSGDSGDGMQLTGSRFTVASAEAGSDLATLPDYPSEIRAPAGTVLGVSSFQLQFGEHVTTPGDAPDVLVAMNAAALAKDLDDVAPGGTVIVNTDGFTARDLRKAGLDSDPRTDGRLDGRQVVEVDITSLTTTALAEQVAAGDITAKDASRAKNMFALGLVSWLFSRPLEPTRAWLDGKFATRSELAAANQAALQAGYHYGEACGLFASRYEVAPARLAPGTYRTVSGNMATAYGLVAAAQRAGLELFYGTYPITPATDILHELAKLRHFGVKTFQAEDEIAGIGSAIGAAFGGALAVTGTSGPGLALKGEALGLAVMLELPLVVVNVQRGGPSTGLPTKTEQSDLFQALYGRNGDSPLPVVAAQSPGDCFYAAFEAARIAITSRTPVILLTDGYLGNGSEPWLLPDVADLPEIDPGVLTEPNGPDGTLLAYLRDEATLARPWILPGTPGLAHRIGGLEKHAVTGEISHDPANHQLMTDMRAAKVARVADRLPHVVVDDPDGDADLLVGWLGVDLRHVACGGRQGAPGRPQGRARPPATPQPVAPRPDGGVGRLPQRGGGGDQRRAARPRAARSRRPTAGLLHPDAGPAARLVRAGRPPDRPPHDRPGPVMTTTDLPLTRSRKDYASDQDVRWCPGCGDYAILATVQGVLADADVDPDRTVFISGIGCSSRYPYYMNTYGMHSIHGRAPAIATGLSLHRPDLDVWVVTGDGDALSIGGNHLMHALRRNVNLKILLFNNQIYGLTKGQYSPTTQLGKVTKTSPMGVIDTPFNPVSLALGAEASFVARAVDNDRAGLSSVLAAAHAHPGTALVEIYQNCVVFNDGAFAPLRGKDADPAARIDLVAGQPVVFGPPEARRAVVVADHGGLEVVDAADAAGRELVHDPTRPDPGVAFALSRLDAASVGATPLGIFRQVDRPVYNDLLDGQVAEAVATRGHGAIESLLSSGHTWTVAG